MHYFFIVIPAKAGTHELKKCKLINERCPEVKQLLKGCQEEILDLIDFIILAGWKPFLFTMLFIYVIKIRHPS